MSVNLISSDYGDIMIHKIQLEGQKQATYSINQNKQGVSIKEQDLGKFLEVLNRTIMDLAKE